MSEFSETPFSSKNKVVSKSLKKNISVATELGFSPPRRKKPTDRHCKKETESSGNFKQREIVLNTQEKSLTMIPPKISTFRSNLEIERVSTPTVGIRKPLNPQFLNSNSGSNSPILHEENLLIPSFSFIEENKFKDSKECKICQKDFDFYLLDNIHCRVCGLSVCRTCSGKTINENPVCDLCLSKIKQNHLEKKRREKIQSLTEEAQNLRLRLAQKKEESSVLGDSLIELIKKPQKTEETICKQTEGCFNLSSKLKTCQDKKKKLEENLQASSEVIAQKTSELEKGLEALEVLRKKSNRAGSRDWTTSISNEAMILSMKKSFEPLERSFEEEFGERNPNVSLKYSSERSSRLDV